MEKKKIVVWVLVGGFIVSILAIGMAEAKPVTYRDGNRIITIDEEAGWVHIEPYQSSSDKFLSFFSRLSPTTVIPQDTIKENVAEFYRAAEHNGWGSNLIMPNQVKRHGGDCGYYDPNKEGCPSDAIHAFIDGEVMYLNGGCGDSYHPESVDALITLGFQLKDQCFWCLDYPGSGGMGYSNCLVMAGNRQLSLDELWITDLKQRAVDLGYIVKDNYEAGVEGYLGWGIYGDTNEVAYANFIAFTKETGACGSARRYSSGSGFVWSMGGIYPSSMVSITEPLSMPTPTPTPSPTASPSPTATVTPTATPSPTPTATPPENGTPGFGALSSIMGLLMASCFFIFGRRRKKRG